MPTSCSGRHADAPQTPGLLIIAAEVEGRQVDVRVRDGVITAVAPDLDRTVGEETLDAAGGALLPGLHDHHIHLLALGAARTSVQLGPPAVRDLAGLVSMLAQARARTPPGTWIRGTGYHESVAGPLTRDQLDSMVADRPVRVQHRGGALWVLNSAGLAATDLDRELDPDVERDATGRLTGRLWRWDARLRALTNDTAEARFPDLRPVGTHLARLGITGVTDATPDLEHAAIAWLAQAAGGSALPQDLLLLGAPDGQALAAPLRAGPRKLLLRDHDLPGLDELAELVASTHAAGRPVAVHCVTREALLLTLAAIDAVGSVPGDRIEHAAVVPPEARPQLVDRGLRVVTQPAFVADRGDDYRADVDAGDLSLLYPYRSLLEAGVAVAPSSDAPFGDLDPWRAIAAAVTRRTGDGHVLGAHERVDAATVLGGYLSPAEAPGGPPRKVRPGERANLCLLTAPLAHALAEPSAELVALVACDGRVIRAS